MLWLVLDGGGEGLAEKAAERLGADGATPMSRYSKAERGWQAVGALQWGANVCSKAIQRVC